MVRRTSRFVIASDSTVRRRYIEQYQSLLTSPSTVAERQDLDLYRSSVRVAAGETNICTEEGIPDNVYVMYVQGTWGPSTEGTGKFNYEKWIGSAQRKMTDDLV